eukprot:2282026-Pyramimonas_sp.AAC.1
MDPPRDQKERYPRTVVRGGGRVCRVVGVTSHLQGRAGGGRGGLLLLVIPVLPIARLLRWLVLPRWRVGGRPGTIPSCDWFSQNPHLRQTPHLSNFDEVVSCEYVYSTELDTDIWRP